MSTKETKFGTKPWVAQVQAQLQAKLAQERRLRERIADAPFIKARVLAVTGTRYSLKIEVQEQNWSPLQVLAGDIVSVRFHPECQLVPVDDGGLRVCPVSIMGCTDDGGTRPSLEDFEEALAAARHEQAVEVLAADLKKATARASLRRALDKAPVPKQRKARRAKKVRPS